MENELDNKKYEESLKVIYDKSIANYFKYLLDLRNKIIYSDSISEKDKLRVQYEKLIVDFREDLEGLEDLKDQVLTLNITKRLNSNYNILKNEYLKLNNDNRNIKSSTKEKYNLLVSEKGVKTLINTNISVSSIDLDKDYEIGNFDLVNKEKDNKEMNQLLKNVFNRSPMSEKRKISKEPVTVNSIENPEANRIDELNTCIKNNITKVSLTELLDANKKVYNKGVTKYISIKLNSIKKISSINYLENNLNLISKILVDTETMEEKLKSNVLKLEKTYKLEVEKEILRRLTIDLITRENIIVPDEEVIEEVESESDDVIDVVEKKPSFFSRLFKKKKS